MINSIKDLEKLLKLCRKQGVETLRLADVEFKLGELPPEYKQDQAADPSSTGNPYANFPETMLTPEQLAFYSSGGLPEDDPENDKEDLQ